MPHSVRKRQRAAKAAQAIASAGAGSTVEVVEKGAEPEAEPEDIPGIQVYRDSPQDEPCPWVHCVAKEESSEDTQSQPEDPRLEPKADPTPAEIELRFLLEAAVSKAIERPGEVSESDSEDEGLKPADAPPRPVSIASSQKRGHGEGPNTQAEAAASSGTSTDDVLALDAQPARALGGPSSTPPLPSPTAGRDPPSGEPPLSVDAEWRTTLQFRNLPYIMTRSVFVEMLNSHGCRGLFDLVYLPMDFKTNQSLGYGFVNTVSPEAALRLVSIFEGFQAWPSYSYKTCTVCWSSNQGLNYNVKMYRNLRFMKEDVREEWKPALFSQGRPVPFPMPTAQRRGKRFRGKQHGGEIGAPPPEAPSRLSALAAVPAEHPVQPAVHTKRKSNRTGHADDRTADSMPVCIQGDTGSGDVEACALAEHPVQPAVHTKLKSNRTGHADDCTAESMSVGIQGDIGSGDVEAGALAEHSVQPAVHTKLKSNRAGHADDRTAESMSVGMQGDTGSGDVEAAALAARAAEGHLEGPLDGRWSDSCGAVGTIVGSTVHWAHQADDSARTTEVVLTGATVRMNFLGHELCGVLRDGQIIWSNSDVWWRSD